MVQRRAVLRAPRNNHPRAVLAHLEAHLARQRRARRVAELLRGFGQERVGLTLALRGVSLELLTPMKVQEIDLAYNEIISTQVGYWQLIGGLQL